jgi:hypothetical protein
MGYGIWGQCMLRVEGCPASSRKDPASNQVRTRRKNGRLREGGTGLATCDVLGRPSANSFMGRMVLNDRRVKECGRCRTAIAGAGAGAGVGVGSFPSFHPHVLPYAEPRQGGMVGGCRVGLGHV